MWELSDTVVLLYCLNKKKYSFECKLNGKRNSPPLKIPWNFYQVRSATLFKSSNPRFQGFASFSFIFFYRYRFNLMANSVWQTTNNVDKNDASIHALEKCITLNCVWTIVFLSLSIAPCERLITKIYCTVISNVADQSLDTMMLSTQRASIQITCLNIV